MEILNQLKQYHKNNIEEERTLIAEVTTLNSIAENTNNGVDVEISDSGEGHYDVVIGITNLTDNAHQVLSLSILEDKNVESSGDRIVVTCKLKQSPVYVYRDLA